VATVPPGCGQPAEPAAPAGPTVVKRELVGTWVQCTGQSIFGPGGGGAVAIAANGTWRQLAWTPGGWEPLEGNNDGGTWQALPAPAATTAAGADLIRFVAASAEAGRVQEWNVRVMVANGPPPRTRFVEGATVANYLALAPSSSSTGSTAGGPTSGQ